MCGGLSSNPMLVQQHADITQCVVRACDGEAVLRGAAVTAVAAHLHVLNNDDTPLQRLTKVSAI